ncbi:hypothetical protein [Alicyclobacillus mengziensis]|uniref:Uncharacterized protein n=1 Tax=Alicyclobacillus mengziensis TaxID=2931921 RepID=A0A9X7Z757_9BACL|nr:hypothetical protein [Alicyclobacillus mengziensis]QSO48709.1 hypothetical protein JZ786_07030 [Alicyclobacillus mengziensis]
MLLATSFLGSSIGIYVCFRMVTERHLLSNPMRLCMVNSMSLAFVFAMLVELTTGNKSLGILIPIVLVCLPIVLMMKPFSMLDLVESGIANLMSVSMSVMLIGMVSNHIVWVIQCVLVVTELLLLFTLIQEVHRRPAT